MRLSSISFDKIAWLLSQEAFCKSPLRVLCKVVSWEMTRILRKSQILKYDGNLHLYLEPNDGVGRLITYFGFHEPKYFEFLDSFLKTGMTFIDVGANIGAYTIFAAKRVGPDGHVFALEPDPESFQKLEKNIKLNFFTNVSLFCYALSNQDGEIYMRWHPNSERRVVTNSKTDGHVSVQSLRLDSLIDRLPSVIDYMKIDTSGFDLFVLQGARQVILKHQPKIIQLELPKNRSEVAAFLRANEYDLFKLVKKGDIFNFIKCETIPYRTLAIHKSVGGL